MEESLEHDPYPHAEGLAEPTDFLYDLEGYDPDEVRLVMRENALGLLRPWRGWSGS